MSPACTGVERTNHEATALVEIIFFLFGNSVDRKVANFVIVPLTDIFFFGLIIQINSFILCRVVYEMTKMQGTKDTSNVK